MRRLKVVTAAFSSACLGLAVEASSAAPVGVKIADISYGGTGCAQGSIETPNLPSWEPIDLELPDFVAEIGPGIPRSKFRAFCQMTLSLKVPRGWSYALKQTRLEGEAVLPTGASATIGTDVYFSASESGQYSSVLRGKYDDSFVIRDQFSTSDLVWSPCGSNKPMNIKLSAAIRSRAGSNSSQVSIDQWTIKPSDFVWRRCN